MKKIILAGASTLALLVLAGATGPALASPGTPADFSGAPSTEPGNKVYVSQIGDLNRATVSQSASASYLRIDQTGNNNIVSSAQSGSGTAFASLQQTGDANVADVKQGGSGSATAYLIQSGNRNAASVGQAGTGISNGAVLAQTGNDNLMNLLQNGGDNQALLTQNGSGNSMSATQSGDGNRLEWTQNGDHLADLSVNQTGGQAIQITQHN